MGPMAGRADNVRERNRGVAGLGDVHCARSWRFLWSGVSVLWSVTFAKDVFQCPLKARRRPKSDAFVDPSARGKLAVPSVLGEIVHGTVLPLVHTAVPAGSDNDVTDDDDDDDDDVVVVVVVVEK